MNIEQKQIFFSLLQTSAKMVYGSIPENFPQKMPIFSSDVQKSQSLKIEQEESQKQNFQKNIFEIANEISICKNCALCKTRKNPVPGEGVQNPLVMVIGEGPGAEEDFSGRPFVGAAGKLLDKMLSSIELSRFKNCFITNIVKCRPPNNRDPAPEESQACEHFLNSQFLALKPKAILVLGSPAVKKILKTASGITSMRGKFYNFYGTPCIATYHPAALLRDPSKKMDAWMDLKTLRAFLKGENQKIFE